MKSLSTHINESLNESSAEAVRFIDKLTHASKPFRGFKLYPNADKLLQKLLGSDAINVYNVFNAKLDIKDYDHIDQLFSGNDLKEITAVSAGILEYDPQPIDFNGRKCYVLRDGKGDLYIAMSATNNESIDIHSLDDSEIKKMCEAEGFSVAAVGINGQDFHIKINDHDYGYKPIGMSVQDLEHKFKGLLKYSSGRAIAWLKRNSTLSSGSQKK
jgi:hypothetical protein